MKQIDEKYLCYWCLGCTGQAEEGYIPKQRCKHFIQGQADWQEKWKEALKNANRDTF